MEIFLIVIPVLIVVEIVEIVLFRFNLFFDVFIVLISLLKAGDEVSLLSRDWKTGLSQEFLEFGNGLVT